MAEDRTDVAAAAIGSPADAEPNLAIKEIVREIHATSFSASDSVSDPVDPVNEPAQTFPNDARYVFKGTEEDLVKLIQEVVMEDPETRAYADKTTKMLKEWEAAVAREEEESKERQVLIEELEKELDLLRIEYEAASQRIAREEKMKGDARAGSSRPGPATAASSAKSAPAVEAELIDDDDDDDYDDGDARDGGDDDIQVVSEVQLKPAHPELRVGSACYAVKSDDLWKKAIVISVPPPNLDSSEIPFYKVRMSGQTKLVPKSLIAYDQPPKRSAKLGTRIIALYREQSGCIDYYSGIVAEPPFINNRYRYLVFFDDGCAQYTSQKDVRVIAHQFEQPEQGLQPELQEFIRHYMTTYNERRILKLTPGQTVRCEREGRWFDARCMRVDCSLVKLLFECQNVTEWIYRGSTRFEPLFIVHNKLEKARRQKNRGRRAQPKAAKVANRAVKSTHPTAKRKPLVYQAPSPQTLAQRSQQLKSQTFRPLIPHRDEHAGNRIKVPYPKVPSTKYEPHECGPQCIKVDDRPQSYKGKYALTIPIYVGFERYISRTKRTKSIYTSNKKFVVYRGPCGRRIRNMKEMDDYLFMTNSKLTIDLFSFEQSLHLFEPFVATNVKKSQADISDGVEMVPISCVNALTIELPAALKYSNIRMPQADVELNTSTDFMVCCDCTDNCQDKSKCACQQLTYEGQKFLEPSLPLEKSGYIYRRLDENIITGVYECNSKCKCRQTCFNRVVQNPLSVRLQIFKTEKRGWGIRCLDDVPNGGFICIYAGQLLSEEGADQGGREYGDEYFAELDFIETCENTKEGYEETVTAPDGSSDEDKDRSDSEWEKTSSGSDLEGGPPGQPSKKQLRPKATARKSTGRQSDADQAPTVEPAGPADESSDKANKPERAPASEKKGSFRRRRTVRKSNRYKSRSALKSIRAYYDEDLPYVMDAKTSGNLGRYLNHSCEPNVFVQNVFVDTHDPRFPWIAFFANTFIRAGSELTWDYGYQPGIVEGKTMYCYCGSNNCRGRLL